MAKLLASLLRSLSGTRGMDLRRLCHQLLSQLGQVSQTVLAGRILEQYKLMDSAQKLAFFQMLASEFNPDHKLMQAALEEYQRAATPATAAALYAAVEPPRQELFRRINTGMTGTESLPSSMRTSSICFDRGLTGDSCEWRGSDGIRPP